MPDIQELLRLHVEASQKVDALLQECGRLKAAGEIRKARLVLARAEEIQRRLRALEQELGRGRQG